MGDLVDEVEVAVLGGGPGGYSAAFRCAELGLETVVIDAAQRLGGACLFEGCIPSKALLHVASVLNEAGRAKEFGVDFGEPRISLDPLRKWKQERVVGKLARGLASVAKARGVEVIGGRGVFEDSSTLRIEAGETLRKVRFKHAIVATGSRPGGLPGLTQASERIMDSTAALDLPDIPERLLVIGGGYIGLELGTVYATLGSRVTLVEMTNGLLPGVDRDLVQPLHRRVNTLFTAIHLETRVTALREVGSEIEADLEGRGGERFDRVLVAVGRRAQSDGLGLEATRVRLTEHGRFVQVDERCRTEDPRIYAVGDITGEPMLAHRAMAQGEMVAEIVAGHKRSWDKRAIPAVCFTDPEIVSVGLSPEEAKSHQFDVKVQNFPLSANGRAMTMEAEEGFIRIVARADNNLVLGVQAVGRGVSELSTAFGLALEMGATLEDIAGTIHAHPTQSEAVLEAALKALGHAIHI